MNNADRRINEKQSKGKTVQVANPTSQLQADADRLGYQPQTAQHLGRRLLPGGMPVTPVGSLRPVVGKNETETKKADGAGGWGQRHPGQAVPSGGSGWVFSVSQGPGWGTGPQFSLVWSARKWDGWGAGTSGQTQEKTGGQGKPRTSSPAG